jgi:hypothetical protein
LRFKAIWGKQFTRPYLEKTVSQERVGGVAQRVGLSLNPSITKKKKKSIHKNQLHYYTLAMNKSKGKLKTILCVIESKE